jgi:hypothetical protein
MKNSGVPDLCYFQEKSYTLTEEEYRYLLPVRDICNLNIGKHNDRCWFIGTEEEHADIKARLSELKY